MAQLNDLLVMGQSTLLGPVNIPNSQLTTKKLNIIDAPTITFAGNMEGSFIFSGSNVSANLTHYTATATGQNSNDYPYRRIAYFQNLTSQYTDKDAILEIRHKYNRGGYGRLKVSFRTNQSGTAVDCSAKWLYRTGIATNAVQIAYWGTTGNSVYADIFYQFIGDGWPRVEITQIAGQRTWTLVDSSEGADGANPDEAYDSIDAAATAIHGQAYTATKFAEDTFITASVSGTTLTLTIP